MLKAVLDGISIRGIRCAVPQPTRTLSDEQLFTPNEEERLIKSIGVKTRHAAPSTMCTSDLCQHAAEKLLSELDWALDTIDVLIFVTQSADYIVPATACALQARMGLSSSCMAFDINLGCSGYIYGIWTVATFLKTLSISGRRARGLLLAGDLCTRRLMEGDKATIPLFGDAGSATAIEINPDADPCYAVFGTDGLGAEHLIIRAGAIKESLLPPKVPHTPEVQKQLYEHSRLHLNGHEVFNFTLRCVPQLLEEVLQHAKKTKEDIDFFIMHQANAFMLSHLARKSNLPTDKVPIELEQFGNTSSASIPLTLCAALSKELSHPLSFVLLGFGVGWSWGALQLSIGPLPELKIDEV